MRGLIFHNLKGIKGWSDLSISQINVYKIKEIFYKKRLFCIFNKNYRYTLTIKYSEPNEYYMPIIVYGGHGITTTSLVKQVNLTQIITKRYLTEADVINEIEEIKLKQQKIELIKKNLINVIDKMENDKIE